MTATGVNQQSRASVRWDGAGKGFLTDAERLAKEMDTEGKGYLTKEQAVDFATRFNNLSKENEMISNQMDGLRRWLYGLGFLTVVFFIGTVVSLSLVIKNNKDTVLDLETGALKVKGSGSTNDNTIDVSIKAHGELFESLGSVVGEDGITYYCFGPEHIAGMWRANEYGTDARLLMHSNDDDNEIDASSVVRMSNGGASWNDTHIEMGDMEFSPNDACTAAYGDLGGRKLSASDNHSNMRELRRLVVGERRELYSQLDHWADNRIFGGYTSCGCVGGGSREIT